MNIRKREMRNEVMKTHQRGVGRVSRSRVHSAQASEVPSLIAEPALCGTANRKARHGPFTL